MTAPRVIEIRVEDPADNGKRADIFLAERLGLFTRSQARQRVARLSVNGTAARLSRRLRAGDLVSLACIDPPASVLVAQEIPLEILFENQDVVVVNKPQGMVVHPGSGNHDGTLVNALLFHSTGLAERFGPADPRPGIVHRLDKDTSGVIIVAKNPGAHEFLSAQFRDRSVRKRYIAIVRGCLAGTEGRLETRLARDPRNRQRFTVVTATGRLAITRYRVLARMEPRGSRGKGGKPSHELVLCAPRTGRTHQLRVHMRHAGAPILGDSLYGGADPLFPEATLMLHARSLTIRLPGEEGARTFTARVPARFRAVLGRLQSFSPSQGL
jgi:23S rRNA pseudouridine1911/1915/1917 synthase